MALPVTITGISETVAPVGPFANNVEVNQWDYTSNAAFAYDASNVRYGLPFTTVSANSITSVGFWLGKSAATDNVLVSLYAADASYFPTGSALATATVLNASIPTTTTFTRVTFASAVSVASGAKYVVVLERTGSLNASQYFNAGVNGFGAPYPSTVIYNGTSWATNAGGHQSCIVVGTSVNSSFYFFGRDGTTATTLQAYKSTAPDISWASVATKTGFTTAILGLSSHQVGNIIHIAVMDGTLASSIAHKYVSYDMARDTFLATTETIMAAANPAGQVAGVGAGNSIVVRSTGEVVAFFNSVQTNTSGTPRARVSYSRRTGVNTWVAGTRVDANTAVDNVRPVAVLGASDRVHFAWHASGSATRTLSAANALNTIATSASFNNPGDGVSYLRGGTTKVVFTSNVFGQTVMRFDSADNPTPAYTSPTAANSSTPHRIGVDLTDVTIVYRDSTNTDLYAIKSTDDGATFGTATLFFAGSVINTDGALSRSSTGSVYQRGSNVVVGYLVYEGVTYKYNEYTLRVLSVSYTLTADVGAVALAGVATGLRRARTPLAANTGAIALAGTATGLRKGYTLAAATGARTVTRYDANLTATTARKLVADTGAVTLTGLPAGLTPSLADSVLSTATGAVTVSMRAAILRAARVLKAAPSAQTGDFIDDNGVTNFIDDLGVTSWVDDNGLILGGGGPVAVTGYAVTLTYGAVINTALPANPGAVTVAGQAATLRYGQALVATKGTVTLAGQAATLRYGQVLVAAKGTVTVTFNDATLKWRRFLRMIAAPGGIVLSGVPVGLSTAANKSLAAVKGDIVLSGKAATFRIARKLPATSGPIVVSGQAANLVAGLRTHYRLGVAAGDVVLTGQQANLLAPMPKEKQPGPLVFGRRLVVIPGRW